MAESDTVGEPRRADPIDTATLFELLGRTYTLEILSMALVEQRTPLRFGELQDVLDSSPNTLSRRLDELVEAGFLVRQSYDEVPPRVEYEPTERLAALEPTFRELSGWMDRFGSETLTCPNE